MHQYFPEVYFPKVLLKKSPESKNVNSGYIEGVLPASALPHKEQRYDSRHCYRRDPEEYSRELLAAVCARGAGTVMIGVGMIA